MLLALYERIQIPLTSASHRIAFTPIELQNSHHDGIMHSPTFSHPFSLPFRHSPFFHSFNKQQYQGSTILSNPRLPSPRSISLNAQRIDTARSLLQTQSSQAMAMLSTVKDSYKSSAWQPMTSILTRNQFTFSTFIARIVSLIPFTFLFPSLTFPSFDVHC